LLIENLSLPQEILGRRKLLNNLKRSYLKMNSLDSKKERRFFPASQLKVEKRYNGEKTITGYSAIFNKLSEDLGGFREKIKPGAFKNALAGSDVRALFNHDSNFVLGRESAGTLKLKEDNMGLQMVLDPPETQFARDLVVLIERGDVKDQSFAFMVAVDSWQNLDNEGKMAIRTIEEIDQIFDVSIVTYPAYPDTSVALRSRAAAQNRFISDYGLSDRFDQILSNNRKRPISEKALQDRIDRTLTRAKWYTDPRLYRATKLLNRYGRYNKSYRKRNHTDLLLDRTDRILNRIRKNNYNVPARRFNRSTQKLFERVDRIKRRRVIKYGTLREAQAEIDKILNSIK
jgi:HK97 family phage prohead protease